MGTKEEGAPAEEEAALAKGAGEGAGAVASVFLVGGDDGATTLAGEVGAAVGIDRAIDSWAALISGSTGFDSGGALISDDVDFDFNSTEGRRM